jgi:hypothetical protein
MTVTVALKPQGWLPPDVAAGYELQVNGSPRGALRPDGTLRIALKPGPKTLASSHPTALGTPWQQAVEAEAGRALTVTATPTPSVGLLVVHIEPAAAAAELELTANPGSGAVPLARCGATPAALRPPSCGSDATLFALVPRGSSVQVEGVPTTLLLGRVRETTIVEGAERELNLRVDHRAPATLAVGPSAVPGRFALRMPNDAEVEVKAGESIQASSGELGWSVAPQGGPTVAWSSLNPWTGTVTVPAGQSAAPLPRAVLLDLGDDKIGLLAPPAVSAESADLLAPLPGRGARPPAGHETMAVRAPALSPGELRVVRLDARAIPAVSAWEAAARSVRAAPRLKAATWASASLSGCSALLGAASYVGARQAASTARGLGAADSQSLYDENVAAVGRRAQLATISGAVSVTSLLAAGGFGWAWRKAGPKAAKALARFDEARTTPFELPATDSTKE